MTWKRCAGCTRAIAVTAFSCEYCGQLCDDVMDFLPKDDDDRPAAAPVGPFESATDNDTPDYATEKARNPFEWEPFPGASTPEVPAVSTEPAPAPKPFDDPLAIWSPSSPVAGSAQDAPSRIEPDFPDEDVAKADLSAGSSAVALAEAEALAKVEALAVAETSGPEDETRDYGLAFLANESPASDDQAAMPPDSAAPAIPIAGGRAEQAKPPRKGMGTRQLAMVGGGVLAAGALIFTILGMRGAASPEPVVTPAPARRAPAKAPTKAPAVANATPAPAVKAVTVDPDAPRWNRVTDGRWVSARGQTAAFEVSATGRVHVWTRDVTPVLVVRCEKGNTEAFVFTQSAAQMEPQDGDHTVQIAFDGSKPASHRWPDSAEHDALFARNSLEFTRQLTQARTLQFGFTPHNAGPVVATFVLDGLEPLLASSAKQCGWHRK